MPSPIIDLHAHLIPPELLEILSREGRDHGVEWTDAPSGPTVRLEGSTWTKPVPIALTRIAERLTVLDGQGIDRQVVAPWVDFSGYTMPAAQGVRFSRLQNRTLAAAAAAHPDRLIGAATVPLQAPAAAIQVLEEALDAGLRCVQVATYFGGRRFLDSDELDPFWSAAESLGVLVYVHPYDEMPPNGTQDFFLHNTVNYPLQTAIAMSRMIFARVFERFPRLRICFPHGGGALPYQFGRIRRSAAVRPEPGSLGFRGDPIDTLRRFHFDTILHGAAALRLLAEMVGAERLVMGSDYPFDMNDPDPVASVRAAIAPELQEAVLGGTAARLLSIARGDET